VVLVGSMEQGFCGSRGSVGAGSMEQGSVGAGSGWPERCACRWGHHFLFVFLFLGWENKQGSGFSAVSLQLANRAQNSGGVAQLSERQR